MITASYLADAVRAIRIPRCEDCAHCRLATHYGDDPAAQVHFARCEHRDVEDWRGMRPRIMPFASDIRDDPKLCGPSGAWFKAKVGAAA